MSKCCDCRQKPIVPDPVIRGGQALVRSEVEQRINEYVFAIDAIFNAPNKTPEGLAPLLANYLNLFTDQVTWVDGTTVLTSKEQIAEYITAGAVNAVRFSLHTVVNPDIQALSPTQATVRARLVHYLRIQLAGAISNVFVNLGNYQLDFVYENGLWKIRRFVLITEQSGLGFGPIAPSE